MTPFSGRAILVAIIPFLIVTLVMARPTDRRKKAMATGVLKGQMPSQAGLVRPRPFVLAYNPEYGGLPIPVEPHESNWRFEIKLKPGRYSIFVALEGFEPTCNIVQISAGVVTEYEPKLIGDPELEYDQ